MNDYVIRLAQPTLSDARVLLAVEHACLGDSDYTPQRALAVLRRPEQRVYLALADGQPAGFCACFLTRSPADRRLEVDLLGVLAEHRGHGLARRLIRTAREKAASEDVVTCRAIVEVSNLASLAAFRAAGMAPIGEQRALLVYTLLGLHRVPYLPPGWTDALAAPRLSGWSEHEMRDETGQRAAWAACLEAHTLSYRGLWLEQMEARDPAALTVLARCLVEYAKRRHLDEVGFLCPLPDDAPLRQALAVDGWRAMGDYHVLAEERT